MRPILLLVLVFSVVTIGGLLNGLKLQIMMGNTSFRLNQALNIGFGISNTDALKRNRVCNTLRSFNTLSIMNPAF